MVKCASDFHNGKGKMAMKVDYTLLHQLWTKALSAPGYDREQWVRLETHLKEFQSKLSEKPVAYAYLDENGLHQPIRLISEIMDGRGQSTGKVRICDTLPAGTEWTCDPCNPSARRYEVRFVTGSPYTAYYPWYRVVLRDDSTADIRAKMEHYEKVIAAGKAADAARREYERLL